MNFTLRTIRAPKRLLLCGLLALLTLAVDMTVAAQATRERRVTESGRKADEPSPTSTNQGQGQGQGQGQNAPVAPAPTEQSPAPATPATKAETRPEGPPPQNPSPQNPPAPEKRPETEAARKGTEDQKKSPDLDAESIRINSSLVVVPVSVTDTLGQPVRNLTAEEFVLEEEGVKQQVQSLGDPGKTPIELALLFDVSRSVRNRFDFEKEAASRFLEVVLKPGDYVSVFSIGRAPRLTIERTNNAARAIEGIRSIEPTDEATAFFDTVVMAARYIEEHSQAGARRVIVVISDGEDNNSEQSILRDALVESQSANCLFYSINPSGPSIRLNRMSIRGHDGMVRIARETGGLAYLPDRLEDLTRVFSQIAAELQAQYLLGYYPTNEANDGKFRRIEVRIAKQPDLRIRARNGYYSPKE